MHIYAHDYISSTHYKQDVGTICVIYYLGINLTKNNDYS